MNPPHPSPKPNPKGKHNMANRTTSEDKQDNCSTTNTDYNYDSTWNVA
jgi:hypothetical protein